jgi:hypothetical protein
MRDLKSHSVSSWERLLLISALPLITMAPLKSFSLPVTRLPVSCRFQNKSLQSNRDLIHKVMQIGAADRMTIEEFATDAKIQASQIRATYSAVGKIICPGREGTAQVTLRNSIITTTAHVIEGDCEDTPPVQPEKCIFVTDGENKKYRVKGAAIHSGYKCPDRSPDKDWIILSLQDSVPGVTPLDVDLNAATSLQRNSSAIALGYSNDFFRKDKNGRLIQPNPPN